ncbi:MULTISPECIES: DUF1003 domain-containing protein [Paracoccus]|uniref:DUF1003 domain-containing protein n=1 Tax=Paracoccus TaxID=265 RepID=UPI0007848FA9|nr:MULTISPECIES: DUF1003 domain-containing protein [Paracoccus]MCV2448593.1 DUF1003 domain-containing protein [Paracoccus sp. DMF]MDQ7776228.1 DUF1003 domain-containing protein [Paracoccus aminovorans]
MSKTPIHACQVCGRPKDASDLAEAADLRPALSRLVREDVRDWDEGRRICTDCLQKYRQLYLTQLLADETGELGELEAEVAQVLSRGTLLTPSTAPVERDRALRFGERMADRVADWGGSWSFILIFVAVLALWMAGNVSGLLFGSFDPYPFILLNLVLSCIAALQAPIIMMSQRRQEAQDRRRAESDYQINLKAELELRQLHEKIDHQLTHQWRRLLEIQRIQVDLLHEMRRAQQ